MLTEARRRPDVFFVAIDPVHSSLIDASRRAAAKPSRGGLANAMFIKASLETLPTEFNAIAAEVTVNYPWASLLRAIALPEAPSLLRLAAIAQRDATVEIHINIHPFRDPAHAERLGLLGALLITNRDAFVAAYAQAGLIVTEITDVSGEPRATRWGKQLAYGSRQILKVRATRA